MKIRKNGVIINLTESDLKRIVKKSIREQTGDDFEKGIENKYCISPGTHIDAVEVYNFLTEEMGYECVGSRSSTPSVGGDIVVKKLLDCGLATKTLYLMIATQDFSTLKSVGDLSYYSTGIGEGKLSIYKIKSIEQEVKDSCVKTGGSDIPTIGEIGNHFKKYGFHPFEKSFKMLDVNEKSIASKWCGDARLDIILDDGVIYVKLNIRAIKAGRKVEIGSNKEQTLKNIEEAIRDVVKKYESSIEGCPNGFLSEGIK